MEAAANAPTAFTQPRAGVPLADGSVAFIATIEGLPEAQTTTSGERVGILIQPPSGMPTVLYAGDAIVNPFDIDASIDQKTLYVADPAAGADGSGAILTLPVAGGTPAEIAVGYQPRSVTVAADDGIYFSGVDPTSGDPGVFHAKGGVVTTVFAGAPFVDPSGVALSKDGRVLVADTRLFDAARSGTGKPLGSEAGIIAVKDGKASVFATGFATGYPAGIALSTDETKLIVSGEGPDRSDTVYLVDVADPTAPAQIVQDEFSKFQDSSAGLKRAHDTNTFVWASLSAKGGTVYRIRGN
jgi:hypothetical protein